MNLLCKDRSRGFEGIVNPHFSQIIQWQNWNSMVIILGTYLEKSKGGTLTGAAWERRVKRLGEGSRHLQCFAKQRGAFIVSQREAVEGVTVKETLSKKME